jgi:hypothetical protein
MKKVWNYKIRFSFFINDYGIKTKGKELFFYLFFFSH